MLRAHVLGPVLLSLVVAACTDDAEPGNANNPPAPETPSITATVVTQNAGGDQVITTEVFTRSQFDAMVAARVARQAAGAAVATTTAGLGTVQSATSVTSCTDGNALWMWNVADGWNNPPGAQMLCVIGSGNFLLSSVPGWDLNVRSIWPGNEAGGIWPASNVGRCNYDCTTPSSLAGFPAWGARANTPNCTTSGHTVVLSDTPISCWIP